MSKELIIVESPTKARTLSRFLGDGYRIEASMGHIRDLPKSKLGVDVDHDFEPQYVIPKDKRKIVEALKDAAEKAEKVVLATDPDREGEAIAWHIKQLIAGNQKAKGKSKKGDDSKFSRVVFHEITKTAVEEAFKHPRNINIHLVDAQVARRVLDRLVGYKLSPLLWQKVKTGLSAGRVQSIAVRLIVEREREIEKFVAVEYWSIEALLKHKTSPEFGASLSKIDGKKAQVGNEKEATKIVTELKSAKEWVVDEVSQKEVKNPPYPPFTTSTMTQAGSSVLGFTSKKTMKLAQDLYEEGLITYHRTDSFNLAQSAVNGARAFIKKSFGDQYVPSSPRFYKTKSRSAQEAHEAIRPTDVRIQATELRIKNLGKDHVNLYDLIWKRFVACQSADAVYDQIGMDISVIGDKSLRALRPQNGLRGSGISYTFRANGSVVKFAGWQNVYKEQEDLAEKDKIVPLLKKGDRADLVKLLPNQHFTEPPARYSEATLIKTLEEDGIGRPSTYAPTISTILERRYVELENRRFKPTPLGAAVTDFLVKNFDTLITVPFTSKMELSLDNVAEGKETWVTLIKNFYEPLSKHLEKVSKEADRVKIEVEKTDEKCPEGHSLVIRYGPFGKFLACEKYPEHKFTKTIESDDYKAKKEELEKLDKKCPDSGDPIVIRQTRKGRIFYGCSAYPKCKWASWKIEEIENRPAQA